MLPKVFTALILATFSYAIAGFVIDLSYVVGGLFASLMSLAKFSDFNTALTFILPINTSANMGPLYILGFMVNYTILYFIAALSTLLGLLSGPLSGATIYAPIVSILAILFTIWIILLMIWYAIKVPIILLKNLISLFISIVVAPVQIIIGALVPSIGFGVWLRKILAEAFVFPLTCTTLLSTTDSSVGFERVREILEGIVFI